MNANHVCLERALSYDLSLSLSLLMSSDEPAADILEHDHNSGSVHKRRLRSVRSVPLPGEGSLLARDSQHEGLLGSSGCLDVRLRGRPRCLRHVLHHARATLHHHGNLLQSFNLVFRFDEPLSQSSFYPHFLSTISRFSSNRTCATC